MRVVYLCRGSDCKEDKLARKVVETYAGSLPVVTVRCQKVCKAPVVGVDLGDGPRWFRRMHSSKALAALKDYIGSGKAPAALKEREAKKRAGRLRT